MQSRIPEQGIKQTELLTYFTTRHYAHSPHKIYQSIAQKCHPILGSYDMICHNSPKSDWTLYGLAGIL